MFEKIYIDGPQREVVDQIEQHLTIEKPDLPRYSISRIHNEPPRVPMELEMPLLEEVIARGQDEKKPRKAIKRKPKKNNT
jgi:hypothetical protein